MLVSALQYSYLPSHDGNSKHKMKINAKITTINTQHLRGKKEKKKKGRIQLAQFDFKYLYISANIMPVQRVLFFFYLSHMLNRKEKQSTVS